MYAGVPYLDDDGPLAHEEDLVVEERERYFAAVDRLADVSPAVVQHLAAERLVQIDDQLAGFAEQPSERERREHRRARPATRRIGL